ncbi:MAG TPA: zinc ABC transporter substrate-binding protein [Deinococcales bacterium]|nr:zinc ABC transporter substrate-binding protein [Deinococcales bacterium]
MVRILLILLALTAAPTRQAAAATLKPLDLRDGRPLNVVTTVNMVSDLVRNVGGDRVRVTELMGPGVDPHLYKASAGDVRKLAFADAVFYAGLHLEGKMVELLEKMQRAVAVTDTIPRSSLLRPDGALGGTYAYDPHVWFDVTLWSKTVEAVRRALGQLDPGGRATYDRNAASYRERLATLDAFVKRELARIPRPQRVLVTAHDAFAYFGRRYGVEVRGLQGLSTSAEAGTRDVRALVDFVVERRIRAIFVESSVPRRTLEAVAAAARSRGHALVIGGELFSDAAGEPGTVEGTYVGMIEHNVKTIVAGLLGGAS